MTTQHPPTPHWGEYFYFHVPPSNSIVSVFEPIWYTKLECRKLTGYIGVSDLTWNLDGSEGGLTTEADPAGSFGGISTTFVPVAADKVALVEDQSTSDHFEPTTPTNRDQEEGEDNRTLEGSNHDYDYDLEASTIPPTSFVTR